MTTFLLAIICSHNLSCSVYAPEHWTGTDSVIQCEGRKAQLVSKVEGVRFECETETAQE